MGLELEGPKSLLIFQKTILNSILPLKVSFLISNENYLKYQVNERKICAASLFVCVFQSFSFILYYYECTYNSYLNIHQHYLRSDKLNVYRW